MSEFEKQKITVANQLKSLCAHCSNNISHSCKLQALAAEVINLSGVPLIVNARFNGLLLTN